MAFYLNIECSKDINELHINFADGSSSVIHSDDNSSKSLDNNRVKNEKRVPAKNKEKITKKPKEEYLNLDDDFSNISQEVIEKPNIDLDNRPVNVANNLQDFDI